ncbi:MAG TPA: pilus assembly protein PilO [Gammaproteobacteria bacterium]|nr:pilus assembly protein PilO [Gammaproteobacteria bacterium]
MKLSELNELDFNNVGTWPLPVKIGSVVILMALILAAVWYFDTQHREVELAAVRATEGELRTKFERDQRKAANLPALKQQLALIEESFGSMLERLPSTSEIPELLVEISQQGLGAGLEFELFKPQGEVPADFYIELPIQIRVIGSYHQFGRFVSGVSALNRIVTTHNVSIKPRGDAGGLLVMEATAKTYRYADDEADGGRK